MNELSVENISTPTPAVRLARLSGPHGYRFDGDMVHLNAMFALLDPAAHERSWALQLWACPSVPSPARDLAGHKVAEVSLPPMGELADESEHFEVSAFAWPPAGPGEHVMVLVLASGRPGQFNGIHDFAVYAQREQFAQPNMGGNIGYSVDGARVQISVDRVANPRPLANRSGTLSLELWALPSPFTGGSFQGHHLAGVEIGCLDGQKEWALQPTDLAFTPPPSGTWHIALMLREWTVNGFVTRDFTNFATKYVSAPAAVAEITPAPAPVAEKPAASAVPLAVAKTPVPVVVKAPAIESAKVLAPIAPTKEAPKGVSVNTARMEELAAVKGLTKKVAEAIVEKRPFSSLDELVNVKGLGEKTLAKVRASLRL